MSKEVRNFNRGWMTRTGEVAGEGVGHLDLWVGKDGLVVKTTPSGDEVGELQMNGRFAGPSGIPYALGEDVLGEDGVLFVKAAFWKYQLDAIKKVNPQHGMRLRISGKFVVNKFQKQDGTMGQNVTVNVQAFEVSYKKNGETPEAPVVETETPEVAEEKPKRGRKKAETPEVTVPF